MRLRREECWFRLGVWVYCISAFVEMIDVISVTLIFLERCNARRQKSCRGHEVLILLHRICEILEKTVPNSHLILGYIVYVCMCQERGESSLVAITVKET